jgi:hypothetical protein
MSKKSKMIMRAIVWIVSQLVTQFITDFVIKKYKDHPDFLKDIQKKWNQKEQEWKKRFDQKAIQAKEKVEETEKNIKDSFAEKKQQLENIVGEINEFFEHLINVHFCPNARQKIKDDFKKQLAKEFKPLVTKTIREITKGLASALDSLLKGGKKK